MVVKQLSVFLENKKGRLGKVLQLLSDNQINIIALSLADTSDFGMLRMMVSDPQKARDVLKAGHFSAMLTEVICIRVNHAIGSLSRAMQAILDTDINVEYMYAFANGNDASAVLKCSEPAKAIEILKANGMSVYNEEEVYKFEV